ncbi:MAG: hypothetical protein AABY22_26205 [Nanoarchaeota archaeon]
MNNYNNQIIESNGCVQCYPNQNIVVTSLDGLCVDHRRQANKKLECGICEIPYDYKIDWYIPGFVSYSDCSYYCPSCIKKAQESYVYKSRRMPQIKREKEILYKEIARYKYNSKGSRNLKLKIEKLINEWDELFPGSGFNPRSNS